MRFHPSQSTICKCPMPNIGVSQWWRKNLCFFLTCFPAVSYTHLDLKGEKLIGTIIIGVGLPQVNPQQDLLRDHFEEVNEMGYAYAYQVPGMNKVLQAAGRVIRSHSDVGIVLLIDERFTTPFYQRLLPPHMRPFEVINDPNRLHEAVKQFWQQNC